jgi:hypothetical protein
MLIVDLVALRRLTIPNADLQFTARIVATHSGAQRTSLLSPTTSTRVDGVQTRPACPQHDPRAGHVLSFRERLQVGTEAEDTAVTVHVTSVCGTVDLGQALCTVSRHWVMLSRGMGELLASFFTAATLGTPALSRPLSAVCTRQAMSKPPIRPGTGSSVTRRVAASGTGFGERLLTVRVQSVDGVKIASTSTVPLVVGIVFSMEEKTTWTVQSREVMSLVHSAEWGDENIEFKLSAHNANRALSFVVRRADMAPDAEGAIIGTATAVTPTLEVQSDNLTLHLEGQTRGILKAFVLLEVVTTTQTRCSVVRPTSSFSSTALRNASVAARRATRVAPHAAELPAPIVAAALPPPPPPAASGGGDFSLALLKKIDDAIQNTVARSMERVTSRLDRLEQRVTSSEDKLAALSSGKPRAICSVMDVSGALVTDAEVRQSFRELDPNGRGHITSAALIGFYRQGSPFGGDDSDAAARRYIVDAIRPSRAMETDLVTLDEFTTVALRMARR